MDSSTEGDEGKTNGVTWVSSSEQPKFWIDQRYREHMYARVTGTLKQFGSKKYLNLAHIQPVTDPHELIFHMFEAVYVTMEYSRGQVSLRLVLLRDCS